MILFQFFMQPLYVPTNDELAFNSRYIPALTILVLMWQFLTEDGFSTVDFLRNGVIIRIRKS